MADWWQFGLEGRNGVDSIPASGGVYQIDGYTNLSSYRGAGSFSLEDGVDGFSPVVTVTDTIYFFMLN